MSGSITLRQTLIVLSSVIYSLCAWHKVLAWQGVHLNVHCALPDTISCPDSILYLPDSLSAWQWLAKWQHDQIASGFLEASVDHTQWHGDTLNAYLHRGPRWQWAMLDLDELPPTLLRTEWVPKTGQIVHPHEVARLIDHILHWYETHGHPFAHIWLDSIALRDQQVRAKIRIDPGRYITMGPVVIEGTIKLHPEFIARLLGIPAGSAFDAKKIRAVPKLMAQLPYVRLKQPPWVTFYGREARLHLALEARPASRFDLLIGILPTRQAQGRRVRLSGTADIALANALGYGEQLSIQYDQLQPASPRLQIRSDWPWLPWMPFGTFGTFDLYKRDSQYLDLRWEAGIYQLQPSGHSWRLFATQQISSIISATQLSAQQLDLQRTGLGISYRLEGTDYPLPPRKGWQLALDGSGGFRRIVKNEQLAAQYPELYDSLAPRTAQLHLQLELTHFQPLGRQIVLKTGFSGATIFSDGQPIVRNEAWRIGGSRLMRGFDEDAFFATSYAILTTEGRLILGAHSWAYVFVDVGWWQPPLTTSADRGIGIGAGITFETQAGILRLSIATGQTRTGIAFDLANPKVHVGYVSLF